MKKPQSQIVSDKENAKTLHYQTFGALCVTLRLLERIPLDKFNYLVDYGEDRMDGDVWVPHFQEALCNVTLKIMISDAIPASQMLEKTMYASLSFLDKVRSEHNSNI